MTDCIAVGTGGSHCDCQDWETKCCWCHLAEPRDTGERDMITLTFGNPQPLTAKEAFHAAQALRAIAMELEAGEHRMTKRVVISYPWEARARLTENMDV